MYLFIFLISVSYIGTWIIYIEVIKHYKVKKIMNTPSKIQIILIENITNNKCIN